MKILKNLVLIFVLFGFVSLGLLFSSKNLKAYSISNFEIDYNSSVDDIYTSLNGFNLDRVVKGHFTINNKVEFFVCLCSSLNNNVIVSITYPFTSDESFEFVDDFASIYDSELYSFISSLNNYLLNYTGYNGLISNSCYFISNNYVGSVGYVEGGNVIGLVRNGYEGSILSEPYNIYYNNFGSLNTTYLSYDLLKSVDSYYHNVIDDVIDDYDLAISNAREESYLEGYEDGLDEIDETTAYNEGKRAGYTQAVEEGEQVTGYIFGLWDTFMNGIKEMFNVNIFGINLSAIIFFIISIGIIGFVIRRIF